MRLGCTPTGKIARRSSVVSRLKSSPSAILDTTGNEEIRLKFIEVSAEVAKRAAAALIIIRFLVIVTPGPSTEECRSVATCSYPGCNSSAKSMFQKRVGARPANLTE